MAKESTRVSCPACGRGVDFQWYSNPAPTVDVVLQVGDRGVVLVRRRNPPQGWALPGGFVDRGESVEEAAKREIREETGAEVDLEGLLGVYSHPDRDPRKHTLSLVFTSRLSDSTELRPGDDAGQIGIFSFSELPELAFDHARILQDYFQGRPGGEVVDHGASICAARG